MFNFLKKKTKEPKVLIQGTKIYQEYLMRIDNKLKILISDNSKKKDASQRFHEFTTRLDHRLVLLTQCEALLSNTDGSRHQYNLGDVQIEFVNRVESYFQQLYAAISALAMFTNLTASHEYKKGMKIGSNTHFLDFLEKKHIGIAQIKELRKALEFRAKFVDHIQQHVLHDWMTYGTSNAKESQCVIIYFIKAESEVRLPNIITAESGLYTPRFDPFHQKFELPFSHNGFYVSPQHLNCHRSFIELTEIILESINTP